MAKMRVKPLLQGLLFQVLVLAVQLTCGARVGIDYYTGVFRPETAQRRPNPAYGCK